MLCLTHVKMMIETPENANTFEIRLHPDDSAINDFDAWIERQKARFEAAGLTVTEVKGACFTGYYDPKKVDQSVFDDLDS